MRMSNTRHESLLLGALVMLMAVAAPGLAQAQYYKYSATATINLIQPVDANYNPIAGYDLAKFTAAGITIGAAVTASTTIDSATPDTTSPPDATIGTYEGAYATFSVGSLTLSEFTINNAVAVYDNRLAGQDGIPGIHDVFGWGGTQPTVISGPSWLTMDNGTPAVPKGHAILLAQWFATTALTGTGLPTSLTLANFNLLKQFAFDAYDIDADQRVRIEGVIDSVVVDLDAPAPPSAVPTLGGWAIGLLVAALLGMGSLLVVRVRRVEA